MSLYSSVSPQLPGITRPALALGPVLDAPSLIPLLLPGQGFTKPVEGPA